MEDDIELNLNALINLAADVGVAQNDSVIPFSVGVARAIQDLDGGTVRVCLRPGESGEAEFKILATKGAPPDRWLTIAEFQEQVKAQSR